MGQKETALILKCASVIMNKTIIFTLMLALMLMLTTLRPTSAQSHHTGPGEVTHYLRTGHHWCNWTITLDCKRWRERGGKLHQSDCTPGSNLSRCRMQRHLDSKRRR